MSRVLFKLANFSIPAFAGYLMFHSGARPTSRFTTFVGG